MMPKFILALLSAFALSSCQISFSTSSNRLRNDLKVFNNDYANASKRGITAAEWHKLSRRADRLSSRLTGFTGTYLIGPDRQCKESEFVEFKEHYQKLSELGAQVLTPAAKTETVAPPQEKVRRGVNHDASRAKKHSSRRSRDRYNRGSKAEKRLEENRKKKTEQPDYNIDFSKYI